MADELRSLSGPRYQQAAVRPGGIVSMPLHEAAGSGKVRVLFVLPSLMTGGAEIQALELVAGLSRKGFSNHLLCFDPGTALRDRALDSGATCHFLERRGRLDYSLAKKIADIIDCNEIDVVHCSLMIALLYGSWGVAMSARKPRLVAALHTTINRSCWLELQDWLVYRWILRRCDHVIFVCRAQREHWCRKFGFLERSAVIIHNGIDTEHFQPDRVTRDVARQMDSALGSRTGTVTQIAAFRPEKGHENLLRAWDKVRAAYPGARLVLAGDGALRGDMRQLAVALGIDESIVWLGRVDDIRPLLACSDVVVIPSAAESFSLAMLEAMAMAVPVVATDVGGASEAIVPRETGELVRAGDSSALAAALIKLLGSDAARVRLGAAARAAVTTRFDRAQMIDRTADLLVRVTGADRPRSGRRHLASSGQS